MAFRFSFYDYTQYCQQPAKQLDTKVKSFDTPYFLQAGRGLPSRLNRFGALLAYKRITILILMIFRNPTFKG